jgi:hypothetical protein
LGGAIWIENLFRSTQSVFTGNSAFGGTGGNGGSGGHSSSVFGELTRIGYAGSSGGLAAGGAIALVSNRAEIAHATFAGNFAIGGAGGNAGTHASTYGTFGSSPPGGTGGEARGGNIAALGASLRLHASTISRGEVVGGAGGITGPAAPRRYSSYVAALPGPVGGLAAAGGVSLLGSFAEIEATTFDHNRAVGGIGGTGALRINLGPSASVVGGGEGGSGGNGLGGALAQEGGVLAVTNSTFFRNSGMGGEGGVGGANFGGASGGPGGDGNGGAVHSMTGLATFVHASLAENGATGGAGGHGGIGETNTVGALGTNGQGFAAMANDGGEITLINSLFKHQAGETNALGLFRDGGNNISSDASFGFMQSSSFNNLDPLVGPLADNGGPTRTLALLSGSPAIDAANDAAAPMQDQRGLPRPFALHADIGTFELNEPTFTISGQVRELGENAASITAGFARSMSDALGNYTLRNLTAGRYHVAPALAGASFSPERQEITVGPGAANVNFVAHFARLQSLRRGAGDIMSMRLAGIPNRQYVIESSTNLIHWTQEQVLTTDANGGVQVQCSTEAKVQQRYFRVRPR